MVRGKRLYNGVEFYGRERGRVKKILRVGEATYLTLLIAVTKKNSDTESSIVSALF